MYKHYRHLSKLPTTEKTKNHILHSLSFSQIQYTHMRVLFTSKVSADDKT